MPNRVEHKVRIEFPSEKDLIEFKKKAGEYFSFRSLFGIINLSAPDCYDCEITEQIDKVDVNYLIYKYTTSWYPLFDYYLTLAKLYKNAKFYISYTDEYFFPPHVLTFTLNVDEQKKELETINNLRKTSFDKLESNVCRKYVLHLQDC